MYRMLSLIFIILMKLENFGLTTDLFFFVVVVVLFCFVLVGLDLFVSLRQGFSV